MIQKTPIKKKKRLNYTEQRAKRILKSFHNNPVNACLAYFLFNGRKPSDFHNYHPAIIKRAMEFGYLSWPKKIADYIRGKDILDVGCGTGLHSIGYILVGSKSYTGMDPKLKLDGDKVKNIRMNNKDNFGWSPRIIENKHSRIKLIPGTFEDISIERSFDLAILHNVTEHLMNIEDVFKGVREKLRDDGVILYHHHNFYCWNGHHLKPKFTDQIDPELKDFVDWSHLTFDAPPDHYTVTKLNRIRLDDLKMLTEKYFNIDTWKEEPIDERRCAGRLTDEIRKRNYTIHRKRTNYSGCILFG